MQILLEVGQHFLLRVRPEWVALFILHISSSQMLSWAFEIFAWFWRRWNLYILVCTHPIIQTHTQMISSEAVWGITVLSPSLLRNLECVGVCVCVCVCVCMAKGMLTYVRWMSHSSSGSVHSITRCEGTSFGEPANQRLAVWIYARDF